MDAARSSRKSRDDRVSDDRHRHRHSPGSDEHHSTRRHRDGSHERDGDRNKRERSHERNSSAYKRKDKGESQDRAEKRARVSDDVAEESSKKERRRFKDKAEKGSNGEQKGRGGMRERSKFEDRVKEEELIDADEVREGVGFDAEVDKKERRRFGDKAEKGSGGEHVGRGKNRESRFEDRMKEEKGIEADEVRRGVSFGSELVKEAKDEPPYDLATNGDSKVTSLASVDGSSRPLSVSSLASNHSTSKVSSILTTNENKGVNITRSYEVPGKSSTDGTSSASKTGAFSLDALAKAKRALQMQKELAEKLKKLPLSANKSTDSEAKLPMGSKEVAKGLSIGSGLLPAPVSASTVYLGNVMAPPHGLKAPDLEAVKRAQEVAVKLGFRQDPQFAPLINMFPGQMPPEVDVQPKPAKAPVLRLDALGREIDEHGNVVNTSKISNLSTLKVNINKQKKEAFQILKPELDVDPDENPHFDPRMGIDSKKLLRPRKSSFQFVEEGKWSRDAEIIKLKSQFGEAQAKELRVKQAQLAKAKAEPDINPNLIEVLERVIIKEKPKEVIPNVEWWDQPLLQSGFYGDITEGTISEDQLKMEKITIYMEHPQPIEPPAEPAPPPPQPLKLTKKEQKKLRTQRRLAREKDRQEMIRQGLIEPPKPKVKMSNLMKVLGSEATQDPTKLEMEIKSAAAEREQAHVDRNIARKLTPDERREKRERKLFGDPRTMETIVSVYKINDLSSKGFRFKVDVNAQENRLTGCAVISDGMSIVVVEGGNKSIKRYGKLMLRRINWTTLNKAQVEDEVEVDEDKPLNKCVLVWQGSVAQNSFHRFFVHECRTETAARKVFSDAGVGHYWDLAVNFTE